MEKIIKGVIHFITKNSAVLSLFGFYRRIEINGVDRVPSDKPVIYAVNHQNAFMDAIIVGGLSPKTTYFMTRSDVFRPPFDWFLDALKMMPIYRIRDGYSNLSQNSKVFQKCTKIFKGNNAILIFPEGNHGLEYYLRPLTKGLARMALESDEEVTKALVIIPVGLNYFDHFNSGHKLIFNYGDPIPVADHVSAYLAHKHTGLVALTEAVRLGMKKTLVLSEDNPAYIKNKSIFNRNNEALTYTELVSKLSASESFDRPRRYPYMRYISYLFALPNLPIHALSNFVLRTKVKQRIFYSSIKIAIATLILPFWFLLCMIIVGVLFSWKWAILIFLVQILSFLIRREAMRLTR